MPVHKQSADYNGTDPMQRAISSVHEGRATVDNSRHNGDDATCQSAGHPAASSAPQRIDNIMERIEIRALLVMGHGASLCYGTEEHNCRGYTRTTSVQTATCVRKTRFVLVKL